MGYDMRKIIFIVLLVFIVLPFVNAQEITPDQIIQYFRQHKVDSYTLVAEVTFYNESISQYNVDDIVRAMFDYSVVSPYLSVELVNVSKTDVSLTMTFKVTYHKAFPQKYVMFTPKYNDTLNIPYSMKEYTKAIAETSPSEYDFVYRTLLFTSNYMQYSSSVQSKRDISYVWESRRGVCNDYSRVMAYMLKYAGINDIVYVNGFAFTGSRTNRGDYEFVPHQILMVKIGGQWIPFDPTNFKPMGEYDPMPILFIPLQVHSFNNWSPYLLSISDNFVVNVVSLDVKLVNDTLSRTDIIGTNLTIIKSDRPNIVYVRSNSSINYLKFGEYNAIPYLIEPGIGIISKTNNILYSQYTNIKHLYPLSIKFIYNIDSKTLIAQNLIGNKYYLVDGDMYVVGSYVDRYGVEFRSNLFILNGDKVVFSSIEIPVSSIVVSKIEKLFTFKTDITEYNYVIRTNDTQSVINLVKKYYASSQFIEIDNNTLIIRITSERLILPQLDFEFDYNYKNNNIKIEKVIYSPTATNIYFDLGNISLDISSAVKLLGTLIAEVRENNNIYGISVLWSIDHNRIIVTVPNKYLNKEFTLYFNGETDLTNELNVFKSVEVSSIRVTSIENGIVNYDALLKIQFKDMLPLSVVNEIIKALNVTSYNGSYVYVYVSSKTKLENFVPGGIITVKFDKFNLVYKLSSYNKIKPTRVTVNLISNDLASNVSKVELEMYYPKDKLTDMVLYYNSLSYVVINNKSIPIDNKEIFGNTIKIYVGIPFELLVDGIEVEGSNNIIYNVTYSKIENIYNLMVSFHGVFIRNKISCNVPVMTKYTQSGFVVKPVINSLEPITCRYLNYIVTLYPSVPYIVKLSIVDLDSVNDIKSSNELYSDYTSIYLYVNVRPFYPIRVVIDDIYKYDVDNEQMLLKLPQLSEGNHTIYVYDKTTGILIMKKQFYVIKQSLIIKLLHSLIYISILLMSIIVIIVYRYINSIEILKVIVTDYVRRYFPNAKLVEYKNVGNKKVFTFIDEDLQGIIYVTVNKKNKIEEVNVEVL